ncbi:MAG: DUF5615 family PIN-like protein [Polyangiales bacterium]
MRVLLDESLPRALKHELPDHDVTTVPEQGWAGKANGELLGLAAAAFDVFVTADQNLEHQQDLGRCDIVVVVLAARTNRAADLVPLMPEVARRLRSPSLDRLIRVSEPGP